MEHICKKIDNIFESIYISKSIIIFDNESYLDDLYALLILGSYPVYKLHEIDNPKMLLIHKDALQEYEARDNLRQSDVVILVSPDENLSTLNKIDTILTTEKKHYIFVL